MSRQPKAILTAFIVIGVASSASPADAAVSMLNTFGGPLGYGTSCLYPNDDGSSNQISLASAFPHGLRFFSSTHVSAFVNTNGNITFSGGLPVYTPSAFPVASQPMIAPYWADVDIRYQNGNCVGGAGDNGVGGNGCLNPTENGVWWHTEPGLMVVTWDRVGYYSCNMDKRMSFQLILREFQGCGAEGDFDVEFRFNRCEWTTGDVSGPGGGFGGTQAQAGFDAGDQQNFVEISGSRTANIHNIMCSNSNTGTPGLWRFEIRGGVVGGCEGAGEPCDTGLQGVCAVGVKQCSGASTICAPIFAPSPEQCSGLDENCNGQIDEGDDLCEGFQVCHRGSCVAPCMEFGCLGDQVCGSDNFCVDADCLNVYCDPGMQCVQGECVEACHGVLCPQGQTCRIGRCVDLSDSVVCDECSVCMDGVCEISCDYEDCLAGETCLADGRCIESACAGVTCQAGFYCSGGTCIDACSGAICPHGEVCRVGQCVVGTNEDPNDPNDPEDPNDPDNPNDPGDPNGPGPAPDPDDDVLGGGCDCGTTRTGETGPTLGLLSLAGVLLLRRRRRQ